MRPATLRILTALLAAMLALGVGCSHKEKKEEGAGETAPVTEADVNAGNADSDSGKAMGLETVHFAYDSSALDAAAKGVLKANAQILKDKPSLKVQIEGHCDERGGIQYNVALGERRANAAKAYLTSHGVSTDRVTVISYGKEKPVDPGHDDAAWAKNRRGNFRITEK